MVGAFANEVMTKRMLLILAVIGSIVGLGTAILGQTLLIASIGLFVNGATTAIQMEMLTCYIVETVSEKLRGQHVMIICLFFALGVTINGIFFYVLMNW